MLQPVCLVIDITLIPGLHVPLSHNCYISGCSVETHCLAGGDPFALSVCYLMNIARTAGFGLGDGLK